MNTTQSIKLPCQIRSTYGKQNRSLRKSGNIPAVIYGEGEAPVNVTLAYHEFTDVYKIAGGTTVVECNIGDKSVPTLITEVAINPVLDTVTHVDFRRVNLNKKVHASVPVAIIGESVAVKKDGGVLLQQMQIIEVEALPQHIPHSIDIDISSITEVGKEIKVSDVTVNELYAILDLPDRVIVSVVAHKEESVEAQTERADTEITTAKVPVEGEEGEQATGATPEAQPESTKDKNPKTDK